MLRFNKVKGNLIHKTAVINWNKLTIGKNNIIGPYVVIGNRAQHPSAKSNGKIYILKSEASTGPLSIHAAFDRYCSS